jgi:hypothetical protein
MPPRRGRSVDLPSVDGSMLATGSEPRSGRYRDIDVCFEKSTAAMQYQQRADKSTT